MNFILECRKMKRTGFFPVFLWGGFLAAAFPILNMAVRPENYLRVDAPPVEILMNANWELMAMFNILLVVASACLMYHTEYIDGAMQKMRAMPLKENRLFLGKTALMIVMCVVVLAIESASIIFCSCHWFGLSADTCMDILKNFGYALLLTLPAAFSSLLIASACKNMWISLGIGVLCVFTATMLPAKNLCLSLFPFAMPFQIYAGSAEDAIHFYFTAAISEIIIITFAEFLYLKLRRTFV